MNHREERKQELRRIILDAARGIVVHDGYEAFSMRKLAQSIGYSPGNLYMHFENKEDLFASLVDESFACLHKNLEKVMNGPNRTDPVKLLKEGMRTYVEFGLGHPSAYRIAFLIAAPKTDEPYAVHPAFVVLRDAVARCKKERHFRDVDAELASQSLWAAIHGVTSLLIQRPTFPWVQKKALIEQVIDNAVDSLVIQPEAAANEANHHE